MFETTQSQFTSGSPENRRAFLQERLLLSFAVAVEDAMKQGEVSRSELAERLETSKGYVTQLLSGDKNVTLRTLSNVADALGCTAEVVLQPRHVALHRLEFPLEGGVLAALPGPEIDGMSSMAATPTGVEGEAA